ncbi:MAG: hypothetical protein ABIJ34_05150 [archaeon]
MVITFKFEESDLSQINFVRYVYKQPLYSLESIRGFIERSLDAMSISEAKVDFLRNHMGVPIYGGERLPVIVDSPNIRFVLKKYDKDNPKSEIEVLERVSGVIAPRVYHYGDDFYAETLIPISHESLDKLALSTKAERRGKFNLSLDEAIKIGAQAHARLATLGVGYNHDHWFDEFHYSSTKNPELLITDFGTSSVFYDFDIMESHPRYKRFMRTQFEQFLMEDYQWFWTIVENRETNNGFRQSIDILSALHADEAKLYNIINALFHSTQGLETIFHDTAENKSLRAQEKLPMFFEVFVAIYNSEISKS